MHLVNLRWRTGVHCGLQGFFLLREASVAAGGLLAELPVSPQGMGRVADVVSPMWHFVDALAPNIAATYHSVVEKSREMLGSVALAATGSEASRMNRTAAQWREESRSRGRPPVTRGDESWSQVERVICEQGGYK